MWARREHCWRSEAPFEVPARRKAETDRRPEGISKSFRPPEPERVVPGGMGTSALHTRCFFHIPRAAKTEPIHFRVGISPISLSRPHGGRTVDPAAATKGFLCPAFRPLGIPVRRRFVIVRVVPIVCPFSHIAGHLIDAIRTNRIFVFVHGDDRRIEQQSLRPIAHRSGQSRAAEVGPASDPPADSPRDKCVHPLPWRPFPTLPR